MSGWKYAFSLSREEVRNAEPPGTVRLVDHELHRTQTGTQYAEDHIQLVPHPSASPADPLNWPLWRKYAILLTVSLYAFIVNVGAAAIAPALPVLAFQIMPPQSFSTLSHLVAVNVLLTGISNIFWVPMANIFGRRPIMLVAQLILIFASVWGGVAKTFGSLLGARVLQGFGMGPADTIAPEILGEVFFVHQRGRAVAVYTLFLGGGSFVGGLVGGYIAGNLGYRYIFWITIALTCFTFLCQLFLVPETIFDRRSALRHEESNSSFSDEKGAVQQSEQPVELKYSYPTTFSFSQQMKMGMYRGHVIRAFLSPWRALAFPGTWVVMLHYGGLLGGIVTISTVAPQMLAMPPYLWGNNAGLINLGGVIGNLLGGVVTYLVVDWLVTRAARKEVHGLGEPESRLPAMFPALFLSVTGMWTFGFCAANPSPHAWVGMAVGLGMNAFGIVQIPSVGFNYLIESYYSISADCFVMTTIVRGVVSFAWTFFVGEWIGKAGSAEPFGIFGMLMGVFALLTIPLWLFGKRMRIATAGYLPKEGHGAH